MLYQDKVPHHVTDILTPKITFYDHPSESGDPWDPLTIRIKLLLNYKRIPYETVMVKYCDVDKFCRDNWIPPRRDGLYILPGIEDRGVFPDSPRVKYLNEMTKDQYKFITHFNPNAVAGLWGIMKHLVDLTMDRASGRLFRQRYRLCKPFSQLDRLKALAKLKDAVMQYDENIGRECYMGEVVTITDIELAGVIIAVRDMFGDLSTEWKHISSWNGNILARMVDYMKEYEATV